MSFKFAKLPSRLLFGLVATATLIVLGMISYGASWFGSDTSAQPQKSASTVQRVTALGRLEPEAEVIKLSAPLSLDGDRISELHVKEGDSVQAGAVIAVLDSQYQLQVELQQAQEQVRVAQSKLAQVKAGAKTGEIQAQRSTIRRFAAELDGSTAMQNAAISRWESEVRNARAEYERFQQLDKQGAIATSSLDSKRLTLETAQAQLNEAIATKDRTTGSLQAQSREAEANLSQIAEVRPVDIQVAEAEVNSAIAAVKGAEAALDKAYIRAPSTGQVLKIFTRPGEKVNEQGIADLGQTTQMVAVAEVYQTDIGKIKLGQQAMITSQSFEGALRGIVVQVGLRVERQNVISDQPGENLDSRIVEVKIRLIAKDSKRVTGLTNLQVQAAIKI